jgi:hypothetical protein
MILHGFALASIHLCKGLASHDDMLNCKLVLEGKHYYNQDDCFEILYFKI